MGILFLSALINLKQKLVFNTAVSFFRNKSTTMKYLNVAEKNDAAKNIALHLSRGTSRRREGFSTYNKIYEFEADVMGQKCEMVMTSVSGHLLALEFVGAYKNWQSCSPLTLFEAPVFKFCPENYEKIKKTLEREVRGCHGLIIWTDCDREGENIGFEIIEVCTAIKRNLKVLRAKFSEITSASVNRALRTLEAPNKNISDAVDVRQELDLRIGAAFTRFQTLRLQKVFPSKLTDNLISYGSCQFPTLGFVVERYRAIENFIVETFWKIKVNHTVNNLSVDFAWERVRLFDQQVCQILHDMCTDEPLAKIVSVKTKPKSKWRPLPLDTVELEKLASRKLKISAKETMRIAEKLYTQGLISYPRTETNQFPKELNLSQLVGLQTSHPEWGAFAQGILDGGGPTPRQGNKSDQAHPPIHPTKFSNSLTGNEERVYSFIVRSFLACCSKDAQGKETTVIIDLAGEMFTANGLMITERNYLDVYPYDKWSSKQIHLYQEGDTFNPTSIDLVEGSTSPPNLLTEADLIALMEKHGIGTDATHAEHIETIKSRSYVELNQEHFVPGLLGMGLVEGYDSMGLHISKPHLRAQLEADLKAISEGTKRPDLVLAEQIAAYKDVFIKATAEAVKLDGALAERLRETPLQYANDNTQYSNTTQQISVLKCPKCGSDMNLRRKKNNSEEFYIGCLLYPNCKNAVWLPNLVKTIQVLPETCPTCGPNYKKIIFEWKNNSINHLYPSPYTGCIGGCDTIFLDILRINLSCVSQVSPTANSNTHHSTNTANFSSTTAITPNSNTTLRSNANNTLRPNNNTTVIPNSGTTVRPNANSTVTTNSGTTVRPNANSTVITNSSNTVRPNTNTAARENFNAPTAPIFNTARQSANQSEVNSNTRQNDVTASRGDADNSVMCRCNKSAILLTVRKQNANFGRKFYKCVESRDRGGCDFFLWAPESTGDGDNSGGAGVAQAQAQQGQQWGGNAGPSWSRSAGSAWGDRGDQAATDTPPECRCGTPAKYCTVYKEGPNKGRKFYVCQGENHCNFFKWATEENVGSDTYPETSTRARGRGRGRGRGNRGGTRTGGGTRRCGLCGNTGHIRSRCPNADMS